MSPRNEIVPLNLTDTQKIEGGKLYCNHRKNGGSFHSFIAIIDDEFAKVGLSIEDRKLMENFYISTSVAAEKYICK